MINIFKKSKKEEVEIKPKEEKRETVQNTEAQNEETDDDIVIKSAIAGVSPEDINISIDNDMVTIKGERKSGETVEEDNFYYQECYWGAFSRSVILPVDVVVDKADSYLKNGILTIKLPKAKKSKTTKIQVKAK